ncbi:MAG: ABC transporter ATP-binding protein [Acidobacteriota bacterium]
MMRKKPDGTRLAPATAGPPAHPIVEARQATKRYGDVTAVDAVDFCAQSGEIVALLGPNGAGKTTLVSLLLGLDRPDGGTARLFGLEPASRAARQRTGAMLQISGLPETLRVAEHIHLFSSYYERPLSLDETLHLAGLEALRDRPFARLSGGEKQRLMFALAICGDPELLFLDEPTTGLDVESRRGLWRRIRHLAEQGRTVVLTTHYLEEADALADRVLVLDGGRFIADGTSDEIKARVGVKTIRCRTALPEEALAALPGVQSVRLRKEAGDGRVELISSSAEETVRQLLERDPPMADLEIQGAALEDAFLALVDAQRADTERSAA